MKIKMKKKRKQLKSKQPRSQLYKPQKPRHEILFFVHENIERDLNSALPGNRCTNSDVVKGKSTSSIDAADVEEDADVVVSLVLSCRPLGDSDIARTQTRACRRREAGRGGITMGIERRVARGFGRQRADGKARIEDVILVIFLFFCAKKEKKKNHSFQFLFFPVFSLFFLRRAARSFS